AANAGRQARHRRPGVPRPRPHRQLRHPRGDVAAGPGRRAQPGYAAAPGPPAKRARSPRLRPVGGAAQPAQPVGAGPAAGPRGGGAGAAGCAAQHQSVRGREPGTAPPPGGGGQHRASARQPRTITMERKHILLVDDDDKLLRILAMRLETEGYAVVTASSGGEALARLDERLPQFVLTDLRMPGMDGLELLDRILRRHPQLPVAILTAHGDVPDAVRATHAGAVDFLLKPVDREQLLACIARHLSPAPGEAEEGWGGIVTRSPLM